MKQQSAGKTSTTRYRRTTLAFLGFAALAAFFLWTEHRAHLLGVLPYVVFLLCPLMHFFHGGHKHDSGSHEQSEDSR